MRLFQIDAFADAPFKGNLRPFACSTPPASIEKWMQDVAAEMNLSETAFVRREDGDWSLRWFTPTVEIALCGHATLATAHALLEEGCWPRVTRGVSHEERRAHGESTRES